MRSVVHGNAFEQTVPSSLASGWWSRLGSEVKGETLCLRIENG